MRKVALLIETSNAYARGLLMGIVAYIRERGGWSLYLAEHGRGDRPPVWLKGWRGDGILARIESPAMARALRSLRVPVIDMSAGRLLPSLPWFETDDRAIAEMGVGHLADRGFRHFGFCGDPRFRWSNLRAQHFERAVGELKGSCSVYRPVRRFAADDTALVEDIARWMGTLPRPVGIMACYDYRGQQVLDACRRRDIAVPDEVAVLGVDNDELLCELAHPPLSSVIPNARRTGYEAAVLLESLMAGGSAGPEPRLIPPLGVATRQSTDVLAIADRQLAQALSFIRSHACEGIRVQDILKAVPMSRRRFEAQFLRQTGRTPHAEILRVRLQRVEELLTATDLTLEEISRRVGFAHVEYLSAVFRKHRGMPPGRFRSLNRH